MKKTNVFQTIFLTLCLLLTNQALAASPSPARSNKASTLDTTITQKVQKVDAQARKITVQSNRNRIDNHEARKSSDKSDPNNIKNERNNPANDEYKQIQNEIKKAICEANCNLGYDCVPHKNGFYACVPPPSGFLFPECETKSAPNGQNCIPSWSLKIQSPGKSVTSFSNYTHYAVQTCVKDSDCGGWDRVCYKENICVDPNSKWLTTSSGKWDSVAAKPGTQQGAATIATPADVSDSLNKECDLNAEPEGQCEAGEICYERCYLLEGYKGCRDDGNPLANCDAKFKKCDAKLDGVCTNRCTADSECNTDYLCDLNSGKCLIEEQFLAIIEAKATLLKAVAGASAKKIEYGTAVEGCSADDSLKCDEAYDAGDLEKVTFNCPKKMVPVGIIAQHWHLIPGDVSENGIAYTVSTLSKAIGGIEPMKSIRLVCSKLMTQKAPADELWTGGIDPKGNYWVGLSSSDPGVTESICPDDPDKGMGVLTGIHFRHWFNRASTWQIDCGYLNLKPISVKHESTGDQGLCAAPLDFKKESGAECTKFGSKKQFPMMWYTDTWQEFNAKLLAEFPLWMHSQQQMVAADPYDGWGGFGGSATDWFPDWDSDMLQDNKTSYDLTLDTYDHILTGIAVHYSDEAVVGLGLKYISTKDISND